MPEVTTIDDAAGVTWVHVDASKPEDADWLAHHAGLDEDARTLLQLPRKLARRDHLDDGLFVALCGIDPDHPADRDAALSIGLVIRPKQVVTAGPTQTPVIDAVRRQVNTGAGPTTPLELLAALVVAHHQRLEPLIAGISEETDDLEDEVLISDSDQPMTAVNALRGKVSRIRRYLVAIHNVLRLIVTDPTTPTTREESEALTTASEFVARHLEILVDCQERTSLLHDKIDGQLTHTMAQATYNLTIVATVFLPLTFVTGLLGMNVAGIPESHDPLGFWVVVGILLGLAVVMWWLLRRNQWITLTRS